MITVRATFIALAAAFVTSYAGGSHAQEYPARPVKLVVPYAPGGGTDIVARLVGQKLTEAWGKQVIVENRAGGNGFIGSEYAMKQPPDGYTLLISIASTHATAQFLFPKLPYDPFRDFLPVTQLALSPVVLLVHPAQPWKSMRDLVAAARAQPVNYGSFGHGSTAHMYGELLNLNSGTKLVHVAYKGSGPALTDLMGGQIPAALLDIAATKAQIVGGKVRALAVTGPKRWQALPEVPTFAEAGFPGFEVVGWFGAFAPVGTPRPIITRVAAEMTRAIRSPDVVAKLVELGTEPAGGTPEEFMANWKATSEALGDIIKRANITVEQ
jgi:tripartite-type tricarboxylate transporter receptor subunit TctC